MPRSLADDDQDAGTDALCARPERARALLADPAAPRCVDRRMKLSRLSAFLLMSSLSIAACTSPARTPSVERPAPIETTVAPSIDRAELRAALAERRRASVSRFLAYREARIYPVNDFAGGFQHVWVDRDGNLCAAATLISGDWGRDATVRVADDNNFIALVDVHDGPVHDWILTSGLTRHEIVAIQAPGFAISDPEFLPRIDGGSQFDRGPEIARLHAIYVDVERQLRTLADDSLDLATDALLARPDLARALLDGVAAGPGRFAVTPAPVATGGGAGFAQPPPA
jgi:hypothetical protein